MGRRIAEMLSQNLLRVDWVLRRWRDNSHLHLHIMREGSLGQRSRQFGKLLQQRVGISAGIRTLDVAQRERKVANLRGFAFRWWGFNLRLGFAPDSREFDTAIII